ncbi:hypothetical protein SEA_ANNADREAMY_78 [Streptomyces phage Annadreamy]|uniref:Uncharacterized protein n=2 Tax=Annadreamyvirus annadreamy TaxID=2846392 RepID=A0A345GTS4_9CAUD|nr:hypothetical protein HWB75_gp168 [Streptomyces phage Annadreamy]AXG66346.1 hypothetical protein SEA_ANNADREAMY_78 [Streptomyces phage Annadreamy]QGH79410.1 hypothetical protein SEA_LIMPID_77 [Streptomyces phage Limpid]
MVPEDGKYRGIDIPGMVKLHWESKPGRWWRKGVDSVLDGDMYNELAETAWMYKELEK